jgi:putative SOS response-associated peptidase YedK
LRRRDLTPHNRRLCGRYQIVTDAQAIYDAFQLERELNAAPLARYNVAPATEQLVIVVEGGQRAARWHHWGLIPHRARDNAMDHKTVNARGKSVASKPAFRAALRQRRCLVPAAGAPLA